MGALPLLRRSSSVGGVSCGSGSDDVTDGVGEADDVK
jgi:hypothetical protein